MRMMIRCGQSRTVASSLVQRARFFVDIHPFSAQSRLPMAIQMTEIPTTKSLDLEDPSPRLIFERAAMLDWAIASDIGHRVRQEDAALVLRVGTGDSGLGEMTIAAVADGVSQSDGADRSSRVGLSALLRPLVQFLMGDSLAASELGGSVAHAMTAAMNAANQAVQDSASAGDRAGSTLVVAVVTENQLHVGWVGDSALAVISEAGKVRYLTRPHTVAWRLVARGAVPRDEVRFHPGCNTLCRYLGQPTDQFEPEACHHALAPGDCVLMGSDGVFDILDEDRLRSRVDEHRAGKIDLKDLPRCLIEDALEQGATDNLTVVALRASELSPVPRRTRILATRAVPAAATGE